MRTYQTVFDSGSQTLTTQAIPFNSTALLVLGDIVGIKLTLYNVSASGTLSTAAPITAALQSLSLLNRNSEPIFSILGSDIPYMSFLETPRGTYEAPNTISNSAQTQGWILYHPVNLADQPVRVSGFFAPYGSLAASGATGGTAGLRIDFMAAGPTDFPNGQEPATMKTVVIPKSLGVGDNEIQNDLSRLGVTTHMAAYVQADSNLNYVTFRSGQVIEIQQQSAAAIEQEDNLLFVSGHQAGLFPIRASPFKANDATYFDLNMNTAVNARIYQFMV